MNITSIIETAEWLGKDGDVARLRKLKDLIDNQKFYITLWGHYSAGKSRLINSILNRELLPVQTRETTAVLTYIQYGSQEKCILVYEDGTATSHEVDILKDVFQNTSRFEDVSKLDHIEVFINDELLSTGLVIVDTPGVNTIIQKHQELAADSIEQSGRIIYVLGNAPTNVDRQFVRQISGCGVHISFVRTKCDRFIEDEENPEISLEKEKKDIMSFIGKETEFIPVSNEKSSKWHENIIKVRSLLNDIALRISDEMQKANEERLSIFSRNYLEELKVEEKHLAELSDGNTTEADIEIRRYASEISALEEVVQKIEEKIEKNVTIAKLDAQKDLDKLISLRIKDFMNSLVELEPGPTISDEVSAIYTYHISVTVERIQKILNSYFEDIIKDEMNTITDCIPSNSFEVPIPTYAEVQQENSRILEMYNSRLLEVKRQIEFILAEKKAADEELSFLEKDFDESDYVEALEILNQKLAEIPSGKALRLAEKQDIQPSSVFKAIGDAADLALLLVPGKLVYAGVKTVANTTKIAQTMHKMGKAGEVLIKAGSVVSKQANTIDKVRDTVYTLNTVLKKRNYSTQAEKAAAERFVDEVANKGQATLESFQERKKSGNVLDALSIAYWTEKFGRNFDSEPKMEIDREEEKRRTQLRKEITQQQQMLSEDRMQKKKELGLLCDKAVELKMQEQEEKLKKQRIEEEIRRQEHLIVQQSRQAALEKYRKAYKEYYGDSIARISRDMVEQYFRVATQNISLYVSVQSNEIIENIEDKRNKLQELLTLKEKGNTEVELKLNECRDLLSKLELVG